MKCLLVLIILVVGCNKFHLTQSGETLPYGECYVGYHWDSELEDCVMNCAEKEAII